jgi:GT2 family glycosyltransferase
VNAEAPLASVIVVCWNAAAVLGRCLDHLAAQDYPNREVIVVDDGSDDGTIGVAERAAVSLPVTIVRARRNRGCPAARNLGLRRARGEIVAFIDADGFADRSWLSRIVESLAADPSAGAVASTVFFDDNPLVVNGAGGTVNRQGWAADVSMNTSYERAHVPATALYPMGCGMALRRDVVERVGSFDDRMLNYYDDVDYGIRVWRAGYRVAVAPDAWIDHGSGTSERDAARKRLLCERHRMRVMLKHAPSRSLARWARFETRTLLASGLQGRVQKLRSMTWNAAHLPSVLAARWRLRGSEAMPERLLDPSWGDGFPAGVPARHRPAPERARAGLDMVEPDAEARLPYGWFPLERAEGRGYRWASTCAAVLVRLERPARRLRLDYAHSPVDTGGVDLRVRRSGSPEPLQPVWSTRLAWQYISRSVENHPLELPPGDYEVLFSAERGWSDPPAETRSLAFALASLDFEDSFEIAPGGVSMDAPGVEEQLVQGWFEAERSQERSYRWAGACAAAVVRLLVPAATARLSYRLPPVSIGGMRLAIAALGGSGEERSRRIEWRDAEWHEESFTCELPAGEYLVTFRAGATWSNPGGRDGALWAENRSLGFALASLTFS